MDLIDFNKMVKGSCQFVAIILYIRDHVKITYIHQYFKTPIEGGATRSYHVAKAMVEAKHEVNLITSYNESNYTIKNIDGITVHYLPIPYHNGMGTIVRIWSFIQFARQAYTLAKKIKTNLVYATSTPLSVGWTALRLKQKLNIPYIFEVRDLWPEAPKQLGVITIPYLLKKLTAFERTVYANASQIIALSPGIANGVSSSNPLSKVTLVPNFANNELAKHTNRKCEKDNYAFRIVYSGTIGHANHIEFLAEIIRLTDIHFGNKVQFKLLGEGKFSDKIATLCKASSNSVFLGFQSQNQVFEHLLAADATLTTFLEFPILETNSPNKFFDGLATSNLSLINFDGWIHETITAHNCGFKLSTETFVSIINSLLDHPEETKLMKANAKKLAIEQFDKDILCQQITTLISQTTQTDE